MKAMQLEQKRAEDRISTSSLRGMSSEMNGFGSSSQKYSQPSYGNQGGSIDFPSIGGEEIPEYETKPFKREGTGIYLLILTCSLMFSSQKRNAAHCE